MSYFSVACIYNVEGFSIVLYQSSGSDKQKLFIVTFFNKINLTHALVLKLLRFFKISALKVA